jgi:hypothetical protein
MRSDLNRYLLTNSTIRPISDKTRLWRYLTFEKFVWLLEKAKLYHTRLDLLGDPFEGSLTKVYVKQRDAGQLPPTRQSGLSPEQERIRNKASLYTNFASCWHASPHETEAMWKLYSTTHAGVAVVSTPARLQQAVDLSPYLGAGILGPVEYLDFDKDGMILPKSFGREARPRLLKRKSFEHENEVRGLIYFTNHSKIPSQFEMSQMVELFRSSSPSGISVDVDLKLLIEEIYISPLATSYFMDVVQTLSERHGLADRIRPSTLQVEPDF